MDDTPVAPAKPCAICGKPVIDRRHRPFCSARCKRIDFGRWFSGTYRVETEEGPEAPGAGEKDY